MEREEPNRILGFPVRREAPGKQPPGLTPQDAQPGKRVQEPQRVLGFPAGWSGRDGRDVLARLARPVLERLRLAHRRRDGSSPGD